MSVLFGSSAGTISTTISSTFSLCFWFRNTTGAQDAFIMQIKDGVTGNFAAFEFGNPATNLVVSTETTTPAPVARFTATANAWYFVAVTANTGASVATFTWYWSQANGGGVLNTATSTDAVLPASYTIMTVGDVAGGTGAALPFTGDIQNLKLWSGVELSLAELQNEMVTLRPVKTASLKLWYPLLTSTDKTANYVDGTNPLVFAGTAVATDTGAPASWVFGS